MNDPLLTTFNLAIGAFIGFVAGAVAVAWFLARTLGDVVVRVLSELHRENMLEKEKVTDSLRLAVRTILDKKHQ